MQESDAESQPPQATAPAAKAWTPDLVELILDDIGGSFKKYQIINYILFCIPFALSGSFGLSYVFTALNVEYRCFIPECEISSTDSFQPSWLPTAVPFSDGKPKECYRYASTSNEVHLPPLTCTESNFNRSNVIGCDQHIYKTDEISILNQFHFECDDADFKLAMVGTFNNLGRFLFTPIMGLLSDRYGRRTILIVGVFGSSVFAYLRSFAPNYMTFVLFEFLDAGIGSVTYSASFILAMEWIGVQDRILLGSIVTATYPVGQIFLGFTARAVKDYRRLLQIIYAPGFFILLYIWIAPESIRWLIVNGKKQRILSTLNRAERINGVQLTQKTIDRINAEIHNKRMTSSTNNQNDIHTDSKLKQFLIIMRKRSLLMRFLVCTFAWIASAYVSYGISLTSISLAGDKYVNFVVIALAGIPAMLFVYFLMEACGRRWTLFVSFLIGGTSIIASKLMPATFSVMSITFFFIGKCFITVAFTGLYVYTSELWPTSIRHSMMGLCSTFGRIGAAIAPMAPLLGQYMEILPFLTFGVMALTAAILILKLPETLKQRLPDTLSEAERIGRESADETS